MNDEAAIAPEMTPHERAEARRYGQSRLACSLLDKGLDAAFLAFAAFVLAKPLDAWLANCPVLGACWSARLVTLFSLIFLLHVGVSLPLSWHSGYRLEHRFGLSTQTPRAWLWRYTKRLILAAAFGAVVFLGLFWIIWLCGPAWWLVGAGAFFLVSVVMGQLLPVVILPLFYKIDRLDDADLRDRMARLAEGTGLAIEGVYRIALSRETVKANAMLAGLGRTRRVLLGDTLLEGFTPDEIEVVLAHEVGHHVFRHIRKMILAGLFQSAAGFWVCDRLLVAWVTRGEGRFDYDLVPEYLYLLPFVMLILMTFSLLLEPLQNFVQRRYERQCDRYALEQTGLPDAYRSAFRKLARMNKDDPDPPWLEVVLFHGHPPIAERLAMAEQGDASRE